MSNNTNMNEKGGHKSSRKCIICNIKERQIKKKMFFASLPINENRCKEWLRVIGIDELVFVPIEKLHSTRYVCSNHFDANDFNEKQTKLKKTAVPKLNLKFRPLTDEELAEFPCHMWNYKPPPASDASSDDEYNGDVSTMETLCSTCLSRNRSVTSINNIINEENNCEYLDISIQQFVCWECEAMFKKLTKFKKQVVTAQQLLRNDIASNFYLSHLQIEKQRNVISLKEKTFEESLDAFDMENENNADYNSTEERDDNDDAITEFPDEPPHANKKVKGIILSKLTEGEEVKITSNLFDDSGESREVVLRLTAHERNLEKFNLRLLTDLELLKMREKRRSRSSYKASKIKCDLCILQYNAENKYERHCANNHVKKDESVLCNICMCYLDEETYRDHFARHYLLYQCKVCGHEEKNMVFLSKHYRSLHEQLGYKCQQCEQEFGTDTRLRHHIDRYHTVYPPCEICGKTFLSRTGRRNHVRDHEGVERLECHTCGKEYKGANGLRAHQRVHDPTLADENAYCAECDKQFKNIYQYYRHLKVNRKHRPPGDLKYKCTECPKQFLAESALKRHVASIHDNKREFVCGICNKDFIRRSRLKEHIMYIHEGVPRPRNCPCTYCDKVFTCRQTLKNHLRIHTGEKPYECNLCHKRFNQRASLKTHIVGVHKIPKTAANVDFVRSDENV